MSLEPYQAPPRTDEPLKGFPDRFLRWLELLRREHNKVAFSEGTFTPVINFQTPGDMTFVYSAAEGQYRLIGDLVFFDLSVGGTPTYTTAAGNLYIGGMPFRRKDTGSGEESTFACRIKDVSYPASTTHFVFSMSNAGGFTISTRGMGSGLTALTQISVTELASGGTINLRVSGVYPKV